MTFRQNTAAVFDVKQIVRCLSRDARVEVTDTGVDIFLGNAVEHVHLGKKQRVGITTMHRIEDAIDRLRTPPPPPDRWEEMRAVGERAAEALAVAAWAAGDYSSAAGRQERAARFAQQAARVRPLEPYVSRPFDVVEYVDLLDGETYLGRLERGCIRSANHNRRPAPSSPCIRVLRAWREGVLIHPAPPPAAPAP